MSSPTSKSDWPTSDEVARFLTAHHGVPVRALEPLSGGFWSAAWGYRVGDDELVGRFGEVRSGFEADRAAMAYASDELPVPEVLDIGDAFGMSYAISRRHHGRFLEEVGVDEAERVRPLLRRLLGALAAVPPADGPPTWHARLIGGLEDDTPPGWREKLRAHREADRTFERAKAQVFEMLADIPERSDLVHGDLLHANVLVSEDASRVTGIFSWKCSVRGDHLYDAAWCTFWGDVCYPGIGAAIDRSFDEGEARRVRCYELHTAAAHVGWYAWTGEEDWLRRMIDAVNRLTALA